MPQVAIIKGSMNDSGVMEKAAKVLSEAGVDFEEKVLSAHRDPDALDAYLKELPNRGVKVVIAGAGWAAHLAGAVASRTELPVIGVPISSSPLNGMDALLSTVQMPPGIPVATVAIDCAANAAHLALRILRVAGS